jgi:hypothetical protein
LLEFTNRQQSNKSIFQNINPYVFEIASNKKAYKKKSESIDFVSLTILIDIEQEKSEQNIEEFTALYTSESE